VRILPQVPIGNGGLAVAGHDVDDRGWQSGGWWLVAGGGVGSMVVVVDVPDLDRVGALVF
jgi:hypothetical protein